MCIYPVFKLVQGPSVNMLQERMYCTVYILLYIFRYLSLTVTKDFNSLIH
jgi:hypothetical protein